MSLKKIASIAAWIALALGIPFLLLASIGLAWIHSACQTDTVDGVRGPSGYHTLVTDTNCDTIGNSDRVRVHIGKEYYPAPEPPPRTADLA